MAISRYFNRPSPEIDALSPVSANPRRSMFARAWIFVVAGLLVALVFFGMSFLGRQKPVEKKNPQEAGYGTVGQPLQTPRQAPKPVTIHPATQHVPPQHNFSTFGMAPAPETAQEVAASQAAFVQGGEAGGGAPAPAAHRSAPPATAQGGNNGTLSRDLQASTFAPAVASLIPNPEFTVMPKTIIACNLDTGINTSVAGFFRCHTPGPNAIHGMTGTLPLIPPGTQIAGEVKPMTQVGLGRAFITATDMYLPNHGWVRFNSPGADALGTAGIPGNVNNHWLSQIKSALLFSIIGGGFQTASSALGGNPIVEQFGSSGNSVAAVAFQHAIPPTLTLPAGSTISIVVAGPLDFSKIYKLELAH